MYVRYCRPCKNLLDGLKGQEAAQYPDLLMDSNHAEDIIVKFL